MSSFLGVQAKKARPTAKHRPAIWECILGTVYAMNDQRQTRYFGYDYRAALEFAGVSEERDPRVFKNVNPRRWAAASLDNPRVNRVVLWIK